MTDAFEVWAPRADDVELRHRPADRSASAQSVSLVPGEDGWWRLPPELSEEDESSPVRAAAEAEDGLDYGFVVNGRGDESGQVMPDPRSHRQPCGVHGWSRTFDAGAFEWTDSAWTGRQLAGGVIYELHIGTFTPEGTFDAAIGKLDHLVQLGVDFVEVLPVNAFNGTHNWGYDGVLWYAIHEPYGGPRGYQRFVDACHARGLAVLQDVVYNHLGPSGNYLPSFGPYLSDARNTWGEFVNLDAEGSQHVRAYIIQNALMWMRDYHVDGLRLDAVHALRDSSTVHLLKQLANETDALSAFVGRPLTLIAESDLNDPVVFSPREAGGYGLAAQWSDDFHHALHVALTGEVGGYYADFEPLTALSKVIATGFFHDGTWSSFREKYHGRPIDTANTAAWRLVVSNQNHDQIGNRAAGDRLTAQLGEGQLAIAAVLTLLGPFTPMLFMGEEWAASTPWQFFTSHPEAELGRATARGRVEEFARMGWDPADVPDPQEPETFERSKLNWAEPTMPASDHARMFQLYRHLIRLRREHPEFTDPRFVHVRVAVDEHRRWVDLIRGRIHVVANLGTETIDLSTWATPVGEILLRTDKPDGPDEAAGLSLPPHSAIVFRPSERLA